MSNTLAAEACTTLAYTLQCKADILLTGTPIEIKTGQELYSTVNLCWAKNSTPIFGGGTETSTKTMFTKCNDLTIDRVKLT